MIVLKIVLLRLYIEPNYFYDLCGATSILGGYDGVLLVPMSGSGS